MTLSVLIVDDELLARHRLQRLLRSEAGIAVLPPCADGHSALAAIRELQPDLVLLDVQMPGMNGFDMLAELGARNAPAVIFVTAFDQFALRAFEAQAMDYLLKPFGADRLRASLERARTFLAGGARRGFERKLEDLLRANLGKADAADVLVKKHGRVIVLKPQDIDHVEAYGDYVRLYVGKEIHLLRATLADMQRRLEPAGFVRIHRSRLVKWDLVREYVADRDHEPEVILRSGLRLPASAGYLKDLQRRLDSP
jgi:two-component system LytT family response regulator